MDNMIINININKIIENYKKNKIKRDAKYKEIKDKPEFRENNKKRCKEYYGKKKDVFKQSYEKDKELRKNKALFNYYKKLDRIDDFIKRKPEVVKALRDKGFKVEHLVIEEHVECQELKEPQES